MIIDLRNKPISLKEALQLAQEYDVIYLDSKTYFEKVVVTVPHLELIGDHTIIEYNVSAQTPLSKDGSKTYGTTGSATFTVRADGFKATGITFLNSYKRNGALDGQAVAFKSEGNNTTLKNCQFISHQDTFYMDYGTGNKVENCYIEGDVDFIFGSADVLFKDCIFHAVGDEKSVVYYLAPDTYIDHDDGFVFDSCIFTKDLNIKIAYLGRAWYPKGALKEVLPRVTLISCKHKDVICELIQMHKGDKENAILKTIE